MAEDCFAVTFKGYGVGCPYLVLAVGGLASNVCAAWLVRCELGGCEGGDAVSRGKGEGSGDWGLAGVVGSIGALADGSVCWLVAICFSVVASGTLDRLEVVFATARLLMIRLVGKIIASRIPTIVVDQPRIDLCRSVICTNTSQINVVK